jgi:hypothetical protein
MAQPFKGELEDWQTEDSGIGRPASLPLYRSRSGDKTTMEPLSLSEKMEAV